MTDNIKFSIIIPVHNAQEFLPKCLESIINQAYNNFEVFCLFSPSEDNSFEILEAFKKKDSRIKILTSASEIKINSGYYTIIEPEIYFESNVFEILNEQISCSPSDIVISDFYNINGKRKYSDISKNFSKNTVISFDNFNESQISKAKCKFYKTSENLCFNDLSRDIFWEYCIINHPQILIIKQPLYNYTNSNTENDILKTIRNVLNSDFYKNSDTNTEKIVLNNFAQIVLNDIESKNQKGHRLSKTHYEQIKDFINILPDNISYKKELKSELIKNKYKRLLNLSKKLFSITNDNDKKHKIINIAGFKIRLRHLKGQLRKEYKYIKLIEKEQKKYPKDSYLLFDCLNDDIAENIDAYSLFKYMRSIDKKAYYVLLKEHPLYEKLQKENDLTGIIVIDNPMKTNPGDFFEAVYEVLLRTRSVITAFDTYSDLGQKFFKNSKYIQYVFIQHGPTFLKETVMLNGYIVPERFDKILISSDYEAKMLKKYGWSDDKFIKLGLPRWDLLPKNTNKEEKSILFMPTWRRFNPSSFNVSLYKKNLLAFLNNKVLKDYLNRKNITLYYAPHHSLVGLSGINFDLNIENVVCVDSNKVSEYIHKCSMLITDYSSVAFDFMFQNKPVICYIPDKDDTILGKSDKEDLRHLDYKKYIMPNMFFDETSVIEKIKYYIENNFNLDENTKEKYNKFFYTKENIRQKLTEEIDNICSEK